MNTPPFVHNPCDAAITARNCAVRNITARNSAAIPVRADRRRWENSRTAGYTLLEMLIAMVLVSALMSAVWGLMSMYNGLLTAGTAQTTEQQLVRSLFRIVADDLNAAGTGRADVGLIETNSDGATVSGIAADSVGFDSGEPGFSGFDAVAMSDPFAAGLTSARVEVPGTVSVHGTVSALRLSIRQAPLQAAEPLSDIDLLTQLGGGSDLRTDDSPDGIAADVPEFQTVVYQFQPFGQSEAGTSLAPGLYRIQADSSKLLAAVADQSTAERNQAGNAVEITRSTLDALLYPPADSLTDTESLRAAAVSTPPSVEWIPEVVGCRFAYFDGSTWSAEWTDADAFRTLAAIRVEFDLVNANELELIRAAFPGQVDSGYPLSPMNDRSAPDVTRRSTSVRDSASAAPLAAIRPRFHSRIILMNASVLPVANNAGSVSFGEELLP
ncbi:MAG: prepilin-type N-terminal cleavage/methylation domain-containing protein [Planctomycetaceae bacterium]